MADAAVQLRGDFARPLDDFLDIDARSLDRDAEGVRMLDVSINLGGSQQRLCRNTAPIQADSTEMLRLYQGCLHP